MNLSLLRQNLAFLGGMLAGHLMCQGLLWLDRRRTIAIPLEPVFYANEHWYRKRYGADQPGLN